MTKITSLDTTLRDGMQAEKISFSVADKLKIATVLDRLGVDYIEAGNPASNIKDEEFFREARSLPLHHAKLAAFGSTCKKGCPAEKDRNLLKILESGAPVGVIFGKAWDMHVTEVLITTPEENLRMVSDSVKFLKTGGLEVIFDAEHFFDGFRHNADYAISVLKAAENAGADAVVLCDTNGGMFPDDIADTVQQVAKVISVPIGIHTHNDSGLAVAGTLAAVGAGATQIQGTLNGIGERCGNANLSTCIANLQLKRGYDLVPDLSLLTQTAREVAEIANTTVIGQPYVSKSAFSHKAGMHIDAVLKTSASFEHVDPSAVGNHRNILVSEMSGKSGLLPIIQQLDPTIDKDSEALRRILARLKELEYEGYQFEGANASLELVIKKVLGLYHPLFELKQCKILAEQGERPRQGYASVIIKVQVDGKEEITAADADGPVHALDIALRKALGAFFPQLARIRLQDYKVRILNSEATTGAITRVLIEMTDGKSSWSTVGVSTDVIEASRQALIDGIEYQLLREQA